MFKRRKLRKHWKWPIRKHKNQLPQDSAFFDPTLQLDSPEIRLFHDVKSFAKCITDVKGHSRGSDMLAILPKCLRGPALTWYQSQDSLKDMDLAQVPRTVGIEVQDNGSARKSTSQSTSRSVIPLATRIPHVSAYSNAVLVNQPTTQPLTGYMWKVRLQAL